MKTTIQVPANAKPGDNVEIDVPGVLPEADAIPKTSVEQIVKDRLAQFARGHVKIEGLDEAGKKKVAETLGLKLAVEGEASGDITKQIAQAKNEWSERELKPALEKNATLARTVDELRRDQLTAALRAAGARYFKDAMLNPPIAGAKSPVESMLEPLFGFNESTRTWHVKSAEGFAISGDPQKYGVYKTPEEAVAELAKNPAYKELLRVETQSGPGFSTAGGQGGAEAVVVLTAEQAGNHATYDAALKKVGGDPTRIRVAQSA